MDFFLNREYIFCATQLPQTQCTLSKGQNSVIFKYWKDPTLASIIILKNYIKINQL